MIAAIRNRQHPESQSHRGSPAAAPGGPGLIVGIESGAEDGIKRVGTEPEFGKLVLPITIAPARLIRSATIESVRGTKSRNSGDPSVVRIPSVASRSLIAAGRPWSGPHGSPRASCASRCCACLRSRSRGCSETIALTRGLSSSMRSRNASMTSTQESRLDLIAPLNASASRAVI